MELLETYDATTKQPVISPSGTGRYSFTYTEKPRPKPIKVQSGQEDGEEIQHEEQEEDKEAAEELEKQATKQLSIRTAPPRLPPFSGSDPIPKGEISFAQWKNDVNIYRAQTKVDLMTEAVRNSLRGQAADAVLSLGKSSLDDIIKELDVLYGVSFTFSMLEKAFCNIVQEKSESIASYASRLSTAFSKMATASSIKITPEEKDIRLRDHFFEGLQKSFQGRLQFMMYSDKTTYADLRIAARTVEESDKSSSQIRLKSASVETEHVPKVKTEEKHEDHTRTGFQGKPHFHKQKNPTETKPYQKNGNHNGEREFVLKKNQDGHECMYTVEGRPICHFCKIPGHISRECRKKKKYMEELETSKQKQNQETTPVQPAQTASMQFPPMLPGGYYYPPPQAYMHQMMTPQVQNTTFSNQGNGTGAVQQGMGRPRQQQRHQTPTQSS